MPEIVEREPNQVENKETRAEHLRSEHDLETEPDNANLDKLRTHIESHSMSSKEVPIGEKEHKPSHQPTSVNRELKNSAYNKSLQQIRSKLNGLDRVSSLIVHQPVVEKLSNLGAQTVARPSGLLGGGAFALLGSLVLLNLTKHYGINYNYLLIFLFFISGFVIGLLIEVVYRIIRPARNR